MRTYFGCLATKKGRPVLPERTDCRGVAAMKKFSAWIDAKPGRFQLVLAAHTMIVAAILLTTFQA